MTPAPVEVVRRPVWRAYTAEEVETAKRELRDLIGAYMFANPGVDHDLAHRHVCAGPLGRLLAHVIRAGSRQPKEH